MCPSVCIRIIIKWCKLFEVCKEKFWRRKVLFIISSIHNIQILVTLKSNKLTLFKNKYKFKRFRTKSLGLCLSLKTIYLEILLFIFNDSKIQYFLFSKYFLCLIKISVLNERWGDVRKIYSKAFWVNIYLNVPHICTTPKGASLHKP